MGMKKGWVKKGMPVVIINSGTEFCYKVGDKGFIRYIGTNVHDFGCGNGTAISVTFEDGNSWWCTENMIAPRVLKTVV